MDISLLDHDEILDDTAGYDITQIAVLNNQEVAFSPPAFTLVEHDVRGTASDHWFRIDAVIKAPSSLWQSFLNAELHSADSVKKGRVRLYGPFRRDEKSNSYAFYLRMPPQSRESRLRISISSPYDFKGLVERLVVTELKK
jgi:hypothetical protein